MNILIILILLKITYFKEDNCLKVQLHDNFSGWGYVIAKKDQPLNQIVELDQYGVSYINKDEFQERVKNISIYKEGHEITNSVLYLSITSHYDSSLKYDLVKFYVPELCEEYEPKVANRITIYHQESRHRKELIKSGKIRL